MGLALWKNGHFGILEEWPFIFGPFILEEGTLWHFGRTALHFLKVAPTLGSVHSSIPHGAWRFHFFPIFAKISGHLDLHI
jgi:hypothetical protein